ncbi:hypothetical protein BKA61DRAFT_674716 [Leptodontidium sp. MPI-SDFR-AT-0119]|nr:hypothetical protein BKA61DRAFT_674716 [Leptodontidium sp. MPI-SDFR-AT-0119]
MKLHSIILLVLGAVSVQAAPLLPYEQCGGLGWRNAYECQTGFSCRPVGTDGFPRYQCLPTVGPVVPHAFPYGQCGGQTFVGPTLCAPGWTCTVANVYFSTCVQNENYTAPALSPTPDLSGPGSYCAATATARGYPAECIPDFTCTGPGVYGFYVCLRS